VTGTPLDFYTAPKPIGKDIGAFADVTCLGGGYDHNFVLAQLAKRGRFQVPAAAKAGGSANQVRGIHIIDRRLICPVYTC